METERNVLIAFLLNLFFSLFECVGGLLTGSVAILSDALHDLGDAASIGISFFLEKKSKRKPDASHSYGYARYSVVGGFVTTLILLVGSALMIVHALERIFNPADIHYNGMILFAVVGVCVNFLAAFFTREGDSLNQKAVNLHMLEDMLGWIIVLVGAVVMRFTDFWLIDPLLSIGVSVFILIHAIENLRDIMRIFLERTPNDLDTEELKEHILEIDGVLDVHHVHLWTMDGQAHYATMHVVTKEDAHHIKHEIREELATHGVSHVTLELEVPGEHCHEQECTVIPAGHGHHHHHHHHH